MLCVQRPDKEWSLIDYASIGTTQLCRLTEAAPACR
jgi:hypothetical protein